MLCSKSPIMFKLAVIICLLGAALSNHVTLSGTVGPTQTPLVKVVDIDVGESQTVPLYDGSQTTIKLLDLKETL